MYSRAIWKYYLDITIFNLPFSLFFLVVSGLLWGLVMFSSFGILIGYIGFQAFKSEEYLGYYNLGFTKFNLLKRVWLINASASSLIFLVLWLFS